MEKVGFILSYGEKDWAGGVNYLRSLIAAIYDNKNRSIEPVVYMGKKTDINEKYFYPSKVIRNKCLDRGSLLWYIRRIIIKLTKRDYCLQWILLKHKTRIISHSGFVGKNSRIKSIGWIPDFQHKHLPEYFTKYEIFSRDVLNKRICEFCDAVILSSYDALNDLKKYIPGYEYKVHVLQFVPIPNRNTNWISLAKLEQIYGFNTPYFLIPAQFWAHKNHRVVFDALARMQNEKNHFKIIATGSTYEYRQADYYKRLIEYAEEIGVKNNIIFTGHITYEHMISLMKYSQAVINSSLFEGWSTTVEEAKSLNKVIVLSDIAVHREQVPDLAHYFAPNSPDELAQILRKILSEQDDTNRNSANDAIERTSAKRREFCKSYLEIIEKVKTDT